MSISMYRASIPQFIRMLDNLSAILDKAKRHAEAKQTGESVLLDARLAPDMYPLSKQIEIAADMAKACAARLAGTEAPRFGNGEACFEDYKNRIARTIAFLEGVDAERVNNSENRDIEIPLADKEVVYQGHEYLLDVIIPHFYFHVTAAYAILRHHGVELGKKDYLDKE